MTGGRSFLHRVGVHPMKRSGGARDQAAVPKPRMASGQPAAIVDGVVHLGANEGPVAEIIWRRGTNSLHRLPCRVPPTMMAIATAPQSASDRHPGRVSLSTTRPEERQAGVLLTGSRR